jgi:hypothetical protein
MKTVTRIGRLEHAGFRFLRRIALVQRLYDHERLRSAWWHVHRAVADLRVAKIAADIRPPARADE